ncbi:PorV/PorQ family protein [Elusimicrobiota bacterium]
MKNKEMTVKNCKSLISIAILVILISVSGFCYDIHPNAGKTAAAFLKIPPAGRGVSMGEAQTAIGYDAFGMWWNPAAIALTGINSVALSYNSWFEDISISYAGAVYALGNNRSIGFMIDGLSIRDDIERRSGADEDDPYYPVTAPDGTFGAYDIMMGGVYAQRFAQGLYGGINLKWILQNIDDESANTIAIDLGLQYNRLTFFGRDIFLGASLRNFGGAVKFDNEGYDLPLDFNIGAGARITESILTCLDLNKSVDDFLKIKTGAEYKFWKKMYLRVGYVYRMTGSPLGGFSGLRSGFGVNISDFSFDYSYAPYSFLGESHRVSLQAFFGKARPSKRKKGSKRSVEEHLVREEMEESTDPDLKIRIRPRSFTPSSINWDIHCIKESGILRRIRLVTVQQDVDDAKFLVTELENAPAGFIPPSGTGVVSYINISNNLLKDLVVDTNIDLVLPWDVDKIIVTDENLKSYELHEADKQKNEYTIKLGTQDIRMIFILKKE